MSVNALIKDVTIWLTQKGMAELFGAISNKQLLKSDVTLAKNYLSEKQIRQLERTITGYFDYIEDIIKREMTLR